MKNFLSSVRANLTELDIEVGNFQHQDFNLIFLKQLKIFFLTVSMVYFQFKLDPSNRNFTDKIAKLLNLNGIFFALILTLAVILNASLSQTLFLEEKAAKKTLKLLNVAPILSQRMLLDYLKQVQLKTAKDCLTVASIYTFREKLYFLRFKNCLVSMDRLNLKEMVDEVIFLIDAKKETVKLPSPCKTPRLIKNKLISRTNKFELSAKRRKLKSISMENSVKDERTLIKSRHIKLDGSA